LPPSGQLKISAPLSLVKIMMVSSAIPSCVDLLEQLADQRVKFGHGIRIQPEPCLAVPLARTGA
jgi:hypothetical protein